MQNASKHQFDLLPSIDSQPVRIPKLAYWLLAFPGIALLAFSSLADWLNADSYMHWRAVRNLAVFLIAGYFFASDTLRLLKHLFQTFGRKA